MPSAPRASAQDQTKNIVKTVSRTVVSIMTRERRASANSPWLRWAETANWDSEPMKVNEKTSTGRMSTMDSQKECSEETVRKEPKSHCGMR